MLNVAVFGAGYIGSLHAQAIGQSDKVCLVAIVECNETVGRKLAEECGCRWYADAQELLQNEAVDMVDICLPTFLHEEYVLLAARYGKHILCEKPIALSVKSFDRMVEAVKAAGVQMMVAQVVRFWSECAEVKARYDAGEFGRVQMVYANRLIQHPAWTNWQRNPAMSGGGLYDLHCHDVDYVRGLFGPARSVYAVGYRNETGCWNHVISSITFRNGVQAVVEGAYEMTEGFPFTVNYRLCGEAQTMEFQLTAGRNIKDGDGHRSLTLFRAGEEPHTVDVPVQSDVDPYREEIDYFAECICRHEEPVRVPLAQSREVLCLLAAIQESLETGRTVDL